MSSLMSKENYKALYPTKLEQKRLYLISKLHRHKYFLHLLEDQDIIAEGSEKKYHY
jgi:hypothetical protein